MPGRPARTTAVQKGGHPRTDSVGGTAERLLTLGANKRRIWTRRGRGKLVSMALADLTSPSAVLEAVAEFDALGRERFLRKYGFGRARSYFLVHDGRAYDSKAIAGAAHGYEHPDLGPMTRRDFSGGDATVRARLEALGFKVVVTEPRLGPVRPLHLFDDYSRRDVHDIFDPDSDFTPGAGSWGLAGIIEHQPGDFVLFVTFGQEQGEHQFDESVTTDGVVTW